MSSDLELDSSKPIGTTISLALTIPNLARAEDSITVGSLAILPISAANEAFERRMKSISDDICWYWRPEAVNWVRLRWITVEQIPRAARRIIPKMTREGISANR